MIKKSDAHFVISNFNHNPIPIAKYAKTYLILDQSDDPEIVAYLRTFNDPNIRFSKHVGHNLIDYLDYIIENYYSLPPLIAFTKGNAVERHISQGDWNDIYLNKHYTFIYTNKEKKNIPGVHFSGWNSDFNEINNSWFVWNSHHRYFTNTNQFIEFLWDEPKYPEYLTFSPGGCYIVENSRITNKPHSLYIGLREILSYDYFPSEAWMLERLLHTIFFSVQNFKPYVYEKESFLFEISKIPDRSMESKPQKSQAGILYSKIVWKIKSLKRKISR